MAKRARARSTCAAGALSERLRRVSSWRSFAVSGRRGSFRCATWDTSGHEDCLATIPDPTAIDPLVAQGTPVADAIRAIGVTEVTYYRWRQEYGGLKSDQIKRMKELETENQRLRKAIADLTLDKLILQEAARGNF